MNPFLHGKHWEGEYSFHEEPVATATGIHKIMEWELSVSQERDTCWGTLEITGLTTYIKLLTTIAGDSSKVDVLYHQYLDGSEDYKPGELLFSFSRDSSGITTHWNRLQPMLEEFPSASGTCFKQLKKRRQTELRLNTLAKKEL